MAKIISIEDGGCVATYDIWNKQNDCYCNEGNFVIDGLVVHNSVLKNGSTKFDDLMIYNAMSHPGPLASIPDLVANRDSPTQSWKKELSDIHPTLFEVLEPTYGQICFQEQLQTLWQRLAGFTSVEAQKARKAVAKKKGEEFLEVQKKWLVEATKTIGEQQAQIWEEKMRGFARYAFNKCLSGDMLVTDEYTNITKTVREWFSSSWMPILQCLTDQGIVSRRSEVIYANGIKKCYNVQFTDINNSEKISVVCTNDHNFLCSDDNYHTVTEISQNNLEVIHYKAYDKEFEVIISSALFDSVFGFQVHDHELSSGAIVTLSSDRGDVTYEAIGPTMMITIKLSNDQDVVVSPHMRLLTSRGPIFASSITTDDVILFGSINPKMYAVTGIAMSVTNAIRLNAVETKTLFNYELFAIGDNYIVCIPNKNVLVKSISKLTQFVPAGEIDTYSFQMPEPDHNYILDGMVHKNSHAASYSLLAYRCMLLKAHFFPEWIAAVLNDCNSQKIPRYIRAAIAEKWQPTELTKSCKQYSSEYENFKFKAFDVNNLSANFEAHGNVVTMGLLQAKGVGESSLGLCVQGRKYESIKQFVDEHNPNLKVMTILIKLGAFDTIPGHENRKALYVWYFYYTKKNKKPDRVEIDNALISKVDGWTEASIENERQKQAEEFKKVYPKKKVPASILKWMPEPNVTPERLSKITEDYTYVEILGFEKEHLGYTLSDPLKAYKRQYFLTINDIRTATEDELSGVFPLECVVLNSYTGETSAATKYLKVEVTDGCDSCMIFVWSDALNKINPSLIQKDSAVLIPVRYNKERDSMSLSKYHTILPLDQAY